MKDQVNLKEIFKFYFAAHPKIKKFWKKKSKEIVEKYDVEDVTVKAMEQNDEEGDEVVFKNKKSKNSASSIINVNRKQDDKMLNKKTQRKEETEEESEESEVEQKIVLNGNNKTKKENLTDKSTPVNKQISNNFNIPFKRIDNSLKEVLPESLKDNSYESFMCKTGEDYGKQANEKLKFTKGRDFKKEKTKYKNKTAFGGMNISTQVRSIKLDDDSD
jgi:hypothetical protein